MLLLLLPVAFAAEPMMIATLSATEWALGVKGTFAPGVRQHLWGEDGDELFQDTYVRALADMELSPSYARVGPEIGFSPIAVLELNAQALVCQYFGTYSSMIGFDDPAADTSDDALDPLIDRGLRGPGTSFRYGGAATLQGQLGPIAVVIDATLHRWITHPGPGVEGDYFFEPETSLMLALRDTTLETGEFVFYDVPLAHEARQLLVGSATFALGSVVAGDREIKSGAIAVYRFQDERWQVALLVQPYIKDRVYTHAFPPFVASQVKWTL